MKDLASFSRRHFQTPSVNRRQADRLPCHFLAARRLVAGIEVAPWLAPIRNISIGGFSLVLSDRLPPGRIMPIRLFNTSRHFECQIPARIVYSVENSDGEFTIGAAFTRELTDREIDGLDLSWR